MNQQDVMDYVAATQAFQKKAAAELGGFQAKRAAAEAAIPDAVEALVSAGVVKAAAAPRLSEALKDHSKAVEFIKKLAAYARPQQPAPIGEPAATKEAADAGPDPEDAANAAFSRRIAALGRA